MKQNFLNNKKRKERKQNTKKHIVNMNQKTFNTHIKKEEKMENQIKTNN